MISYIYVISVNKSKLTQVRKIFLLHLFLKKIIFLKDLCKEFKGYKAEKICQSNKFVDNGQNIFSKLSDDDVAMICVRTLNMD